LFCLGLVDILGAEAPAQDDGAVLDQGVESSAESRAAHPSARAKNMYIKHQNFGTFLKFTHLSKMFGSI
jgi:hypothetical protein